ncbi:PepSY domain-containing protein [Sphingomonas sp. C3-2]|uniref:PepSY domain-containing protein n=1 Tax=Sphingomonas sp. C3-2 TaxID=3062169 RepID=UPI00294B7882|nr:PepSY domain-containing protein [Sphingomonas sp. C3-2]WOK35405.1 PepSY domain-containing protein [Sphingomonas sp. C3-2]
MKMMTRLICTIAVSLSAGAMLAPAQAQARRGDQDSAYQAVQRGHVMSLREIESRVLPSVRGAEYLGPEFDRGRAVYRLKFRRDVRVFWVDVDARTGDVVARSDR